jgi:hypothetical protein
MRSANRFIAPQFARLSLCGRNIHAEDLAQVTRSSIPVKVISSM